MRCERAIRFVIRDGAGQFTRAFDDVFRADGATIIRTPSYTAVANAYAERWVGTVRRELCDRTLVWNRHHLERLLAEYVEHYQRAPAPPITRSTRAQRRRRCRVSAWPADPSTNQLQRTHQRIPPRRLNKHNGQPNTSANSTSTRPRPAPTPRNRHRPGSKTARTPFPAPTGLCSTFCTENIPSASNGNSGQNWSWVSIPAADTPLHVVDTDLDPAARKTAAAKADDILANNAVALPLDPLPDMCIWNDKVVGPIWDCPMFCVSGRDGHWWLVAIRSP
jgi:hypothetical protein